MINGLALYHFQGALTGRVLIDRQPVDQLEAADISTQVGTLFQDPESQFFALDVRDEIAMGHEWRQVPPKETQRRIGQAATQFGLTNILDRSILALSEGQKQKVALASIMSLGPQALVLDEPTANLDPESTEALAEILLKIKAQGVAILIVDHRLYWLRNLADKVAVMDQGRIVAQGTFDLIDDPVLRRHYGLRKSRVTDPRPELLPPDPTTNHAIRLEGLCYAHGPQAPIFRDANLALPMGQVIGLLGPNGTGKTTLAMLLTGLLKAQKGKLIFDGQPLKPSELLSKASVILQNTDHQLHGQTVSAEVAASLPRKQTEDPETQVLALLNKYNIAHLAQRHPQSLSGGEKQRLVIACGEAKKPDVLILDEPSSGLDGANMHLIADCARDFAERGACVLLISHDLELLGTACRCALTLPLKQTTSKESPHEHPISPSGPYPRTDHRKAQHHARCSGS